MNGRDQMIIFIFTFSI